MNKQFVTYRAVIAIVIAMPLALLSQQDKVPVSTISTGGGISTGGSVRLSSITGEGIIGPTSAQGLKIVSGTSVGYEVQRALGTESAPMLPEVFALHQNYPNPFNPATTIQFDLPMATDIRIVVYDLLGREVVRLVDRRLEPGYHQLVWNGRDRRGREVPTGMYIVLMATPDFKKSIKLVLLK